MQLKEACPPHKLGDLEALVKTLKGDEAKIRQTIAEWWEDGATVEQPEEWNDVSKNKSLKPKPTRGGRSGRGGGRGVGRGDRKQRSYDKKKSSPKASPASGAPATAPTEPVAVATESTTPALPKSPEVAPVPQPSPSPPVPSPQVGKGASTTPQRNVWTTKGSAHLIRAEKPEPAPPVVKEAPPKKEVAVVTPPSPLPAQPQQPAILEAPPAPAAVPKVAKPVETPAATAWEEPPQQRKPTSSVNMGRWEMKEAASHDFEFGSFQEEAAPVEPARPPPGLSMPPMPSNAVLVHELEDKLEQVAVVDAPEPAGVPPSHANMVPPYATGTRSTAAAPYGASYGYNANSTTNPTGTGFSAAKPYNGAASSGSGPSEVLPVPPQNPYGGPMYYQHHQMHLPGQHQPPYNFAGYTQLGYAFPPNYNYNGGASGAGGQEDSKNNRNRSNQNYQQYAPYMSNHGYDPRYEHGYVPPQGAHQQQQQQHQSSYSTFENDYSKKNKGRGNNNTNLHSQFQGGPPNFLQHDQHQHPPQQQPPEWNTTGWNANTWQNGK